ncbi:transcriptional regulator, partial [Xanthomonas hortorum pv. gardneri]
QLALQRIGSPERASQRLTAAVALNIRASSACSPSVLTHHPPGDSPAHSPTKASGR